MARTVFKYFLISKISRFYSEITAIVAMLMYLKTLVIMANLKNTITLNDYLIGCIVPQIGRVEWLFLDCPAIEKLACSLLHQNVNAGHYGRPSYERESNGLEES